jgi:hypothetical protein
MAPAVTGVKQARHRRNVVLPAPDRPMTAINSPQRTLTVTFRSAWRDPNVLLTRSSARIGGGWGLIT